MLFNSYPFILIFLPLTLGLYFLLARLGALWAARWLVLASLFFYGWWNPAYLGLLLFSIGFNFALGRWMDISRQNAHASRSTLLVLGIAGNLALLAYFKYADFLLGIAGQPELSLVLPLGISFFTFTQIAFLVDAYRGLAMTRNLTHYALFVSYFPHLIAGPILHHREIMPQFDRLATYRARSKNFAIGLTFFALGLFKKTVLADGIAPYANILFEGADQGANITLVDAWCGALAYTLQLYFDFSGYSDMAIGISRLFGVHLPLNFASPYQASSLIDFWRRWHMTLSRFLRDYLYIPLGGSRKGPLRHTLSLMTTLVLGGLWHGAGWTFLLWGGFHGMALLVNHAWRSWQKKWPALRLPHLAGVLLTFVVVVVGWVLFRAHSLEAAWRILQGMAGLQGITLPSQTLQWLGPLGIWLQDNGVQFGKSALLRGLTELAWVGMLLCMVWFLPNSQQWVRQYGNRPGWAWVMGCVLALGILNIAQTSEFLYYQF